MKITLELENYELRDLMLAEVKKEVSKVVQGAFQDYNLDEYQLKEHIKQALIYNAEAREHMDIVVSKALNAVKDEDFKNIFMEHLAKKL